jgi:hypothetical protein
VPDRVFDDPVAHECDGHAQDQQQDRNQPKVGLSRADDGVIAQEEQYRFVPDVQAEADGSDPGKERACQRTAPQCVGRSEHRRSEQRHERDHAQLVEHRH